MENKLTYKQKKFVNEYLIDLNATKAAIRAGYSEKNADKIGPELLGKTRVKAAIDKRMKDREERTEITQDMVLRELARIALANGADFAKVETRTGYQPIIDKEGKIVGQEPFEYKTVEVIETKEVPEDKRAAIAGIRHGRNGIEVKMNDKVKALELLGRHLGMFTDKVEHSGPNGEKLEVIFNIPRPKDE